MFNLKSKLTPSRYKISIIFLVAMIIGSLFIYLWINSTYKKIFITHKSSSGLISIRSNTLAGNFQNKTAFNILLLGYGGGNHDGAYLTDSMILVHIDPKLGKVTILSIPRDLWVMIPTNQTKGDHWKINVALTVGMDDKSYPNKLAEFKGQDGGGQLAEYIVSQVTGLPVNHYIGIDFSGFKNTIDALGGVDINVETTFDDPEYPIDGKENDLCGQTQDALPKLEQIASISATQAFPCRYQNLHFDQGLQHMNGERALSYVRSRHSLQDGTDFGRAKRQRNLLLAVEKKVVSIGFIPKIIPFMNSLQNDVKTDLTLDDIKTLVDYSNTLSKYSTTTIALTDQNYLQDSFSDDGQAILTPKAGLDNYAPIHNWVASYTDPSYVNKNPVVQVLNGTHIIGLAALATKRINNLGINTIDPTDAVDQTDEITSIALYKNNIDPNIITKLGSEFGVKPTQVKQAGQSATSLTYDVLITVGQDYNLKQGKKVLNE